MVPLAHPWYPSFKNGMYFAFTLGCFVSICRCHKRFLAVWVPFSGVDRLGVDRLLALAVG